MSSIFTSAVEGKPRHTWNLVGAGNVAGVEKVYKGNQHGFCKGINSSEILGYHFAEVLKVQTPKAEIGIVNNECKLITINCDISCRDLNEALNFKLHMDASLSKACKAFPFLSWLAHGDYVKSENWIRDICFDEVRVMPIDFECALKSELDIIGISFPKEIERVPELIKSGIVDLENLQDDDIRMPMRFYNFSDRAIEAALTRRDKIRGSYREAGLIE